MPPNSITVTTHLPASTSLEFLRGNMLRLNGARVPLLSGEVQFFRMNPDVWETCLHQVKALGLPIVSTYLSWRRFSLGPDQYDLTGRTDPRLNLPHFLNLCSAIGLWVTLKPGPWICAEEANGGYPDWLVSAPQLQVLDSQDRPVMGYNPPFQSPIPSYLHPHYQEHVRHWLEAVDRVIAAYCYPMGPVVLVQLDNEPSYTFHDRMFESDYNPQIVGEDGLYSQWLRTKYTSVEGLNAAYQASWTDFVKVQPPRSLELHSLAELPRYMDWVEFKEWLLAKHVQSIGEHHLRNGLGQTLFTVNYNEHPQLAVPNDWHGLERASGIGGYDYYPHMPMQPEDFVGVVQAVNYSRCVNRVPWSPEIMCGIWSFEGQEHDPRHLKSEDFEYLYLTCLAYGLKGMNFYMLADRDNWVNSPLDRQGKVTETAQAIKKTVQLMHDIPTFYDLEIEQPVGVLYYRPYAREAFIAHETPTNVEGYTLGEAYTCFKLIYAELLKLNCNPGLVDLWVSPQRMEQYELVILPAGPYMDQETQKRLVDYVSGGGKLAVFPTFPSKDLDFSPLSLIVSDGESTGDAVGPWFQHSLGKGRWFDFSSPRPSGDNLAWLLRTLHLFPKAATAVTRVTTTFHRGNGLEILFVVNTQHEPALSSLFFRDRRAGRLVEILDPAAVVPIRRGEATLSLPAHSVKAFFVRD